MQMCAFVHGAAAAHTYKPHCDVCMELRTRNFYYDRSLHAPCNCFKGSLVKVKWNISWQLQYIGSSICNIKSHYIIRHTYIWDLLWLQLFVLKRYRSFSDPMATALRISRYSASALRSGKSDKGARTVGIYRYGSGWFFRIRDVVFLRTQIGWSPSKVL